MVQINTVPAGESQTIAGWVACPECGEELPIGLTPLKLGLDENGVQVASADLQMDDLWAHAWTHRDQVPDPSECPDHAPVQHRDGKPPWCRTCGWTSARDARPATHKDDLQL